jgi:glycerol-3-phosphate acyltransferase PlsY
MGIYLDSTHSVSHIGDKIYAYVLEDLLKIVLLIISAFILGSIPTGLILAKSSGVDLKKAGSGNIGATNVLRTTGRWPAFFTLLGDVLKGVAAVLLARFFEVGLLYEGFIGLSSILGHNFSLFLKFKGGKGVATSFGVLVVYSPQTALFTSIIWLLTIMITKYSSLGALVSYGLLPLSISFLDTKEKLPIAFVMTIMMFIRHKDNISHLLNGTELKIGRKA